MKRLAHCTDGHIQGPDGHAQGHPACDSGARIWILGLPILLRRTAGGVRAGWGLQRTRRTPWLLKSHPALELEGTPRRYKTRQWHRCAHSPRGRSGPALGLRLPKHKDLKMPAGGSNAGNCFTSFLSRVRAEHFGFHFGRSEVARILRGCWRDPRRPLAAFDQGAFDSDFPNLHSWSRPFQI